MQDCHVEDDGSVEEKMLLNMIKFIKRLLVHIFTLLVLLLWSKRNLKAFTRIKLSLTLSNKITLLCCCDVERNPGPTVDKLRRLLPELRMAYLEVDSKSEFTNKNKNVTKSDNEETEKNTLYGAPPPNWDKELWFGDPNNKRKCKDKSIMQMLLEMVLGHIICMHQENRNFTNHQYLAINIALTEDEQSDQDNTNQKIMKLVEKLKVYPAQLVCDGLKACKPLWQAITNSCKADADNATKANQFQPMIQDADAKDSSPEDLIKKLQKLLTDEKEKVEKIKKNATRKKTDGGGKGKGKKKTDGGGKGKGKKRKIPEVRHGSEVDGDVCSGNGMIGDSSNNMDITGSNRDNNGKDDGTILYSAIPVAVSPSVIVCDDEVPGPSGITTYHQQKTCEEKGRERNIHEVSYGSGVDGVMCSDNGMIGDSCNNMDCSTTPGGTRSEVARRLSDVMELIAADCSGEISNTAQTTHNSSDCSDIPSSSRVDHDPMKTCEEKGRERNITEVSYGSGVDNVMCSDNGMIGDSCNNMDCSTIPGETRSEVARRLSDVMEVIAADYSGEISNTAQTTHNSSDCSDIQWSSCVDHDPMVSGSNRDINGKDDDTIPYSAISVAVSPSVTVCDDEVSGLSGITTCNQPQSPAKKRKLTDHECSSDEDICELNYILEKKLCEWDEKDEDLAHY